MKVAIIVDADAPDFYAQVGQINQLLHMSGHLLCSMELWLFSLNAPRHTPCLAAELAKLRWVSAPRLVEARLTVLQQMQQAFAMELLLFAGEQADELATRLAYRCQGSACCAVEQVQITAMDCRVIKAVYSNHMRAELSMAGKPWCLSVARGGISCTETLPISTAAERFEPVEAEIGQWVLASSQIPPPEMAPINQARCVLAIGEGAGSAQNAAYLRQLATRLAAELAASRPVVMNGWCEMDRLLGMSGAIIAPEICIAAGVSGAPAFTLGIRHSKLIVAINHDPQAPIFAQADVGIVADMNPALEALANLL